MKLQRRYELTFLATVAGVAFFAWLAVKVSGAFVLGVLLSFVVGAIALAAIACPKCGHFLSVRQARVFGSLMPITAMRMPSACPNCGEKLD